MNHANVSRSHREGSLIVEPEGWRERDSSNGTIIARRSPRRSPYDEESYTRYDSYLNPSQITVRATWQRVEHQRRTTARSRNDASRSWSPLVSDQWRAGPPFAFSRLNLLRSARRSYAETRLLNAFVEDGATPWPQSHVSHQPRAIYATKMRGREREKNWIESHWLRLTRRTRCVHYVVHYRARGGARAKAHVVYGCLFKRVHVSCTFV